MFLLMLFSVFFASYSAFALPDDCEVKLRPSLWTVAPKGSQLLIGMLGEEKGGTRLLAVSDYFCGDHETLHAHLKANYDLKRFLWAGELYIENDLDQPARGKIVFSINTSRYATLVLQNDKSENINSVQEFTSTLEKYATNLITPFTNHFEFSNEHAHLEPFSQKLHNRVRYSQGDTVRHRFRNIMIAITYLAQYLTQNPAANWRETLEVMSTISTQTISDIVEVLVAKEKYSQGRGRKARYKAIESVEKLGKDSGPISHADFVAFVELIKSVGETIDKSRDEPEVIYLGSPRRP